MQAVRANVATNATDFGVGDAFNGARVREYDTSPDRPVPERPWRRWK